MKRFSLLGALVVLVCISVMPSTPTQAAPLNPEITLEIEPRVLRPAQAGYIYVDGSRSMDVVATMNGEPLTTFWAGHGYMAFLAFGFDAEPGVRRIEVTATDPLTRQTVTFDEQIELTNYRYPLEQVALPFALQPLLDPDLNIIENTALEEVYRQTTTPDTFDWPFDSPVPFGIITSRFGGDRIYNGGVWQQYHTGADFRRSVGEPIYATADGRVAATLPLDIYGNVLLIDHGYGVFSLYAHNSEWYVAEGEYLQQGQIITAAGATGRTNGPHLHWEIIVNGVKVDPIAWLALDPGYVPLREVTPGQE